MSHITPEIAAKISESVKQAHEMLSNVKLTPEERAWVIKQSNDVFKTVSEKLLTSKGYSAVPCELRELVVPSAIAFALSLAHDWSLLAEQTRLNEQKEA